MGFRQPKDLRERVRWAAELTLERNGSVGPLELYQTMGWLQPSHVESWRKAHSAFPVLEQFIQGSPQRRALANQFFLEWVHEQGLEPVPASYKRAGVHGEEPLRITATGDAEAEEFFTTHFAPASLTPRKAERLKEKLNKAPELVVFQLVSDESQCGECQETLFRGTFIILEKQTPLCLTCADMDHLEFLPSGDATLTRRARKYSKLSAVVVRFNRTRKRYERQGILVSPEAVSQAEQECLADAPQREARRIKEAARRTENDRELVAEMTERILQRYPQCPAKEARRIAEHTAERGSGRVGRSAAGQSLSLPAIELAVLAWIRHQHTDYDELLMQGIPRLTARDMIRAKVQAIAAKWTHTFVDQPQ